MKVFVNVLTIARFFGVLGLVAIKNGVSKLIFFVYIITLLLTDWLDGMLARKFNVQTLFGSVLDAVADKIFNITLLVFLAEKNNLFLFILIGEVIIALINLASFALGKKTASSLFGKIKMWALSISIVFGYMGYFSIIKNEIIIIAGIIITFILQLLAMFGYVKSIIIQKGTKRKRRKIETTKDLKYILFNTDYYLSTLN